MSQKQKPSNTELPFLSAQGNPSPPTTADWKQDWKPLRVFNIYRLVLALVFLLMYWVNVAPNFFGQYDPTLYLVVSIFYLLWVIWNGVAIHYRWLSLGLQVMAQGIVDIIAISLIMHASGGISSGLGILLGVAIVGSSVLSVGVTAVFFAALASLVVLLEVVLADIYGWFDTTTYTQAGLLGAVFFAIAYLAHVLAKRLRVSEHLAQQRAQYVQQLSELNAHIVQHIRSGIVVIDSSQCIRLCNEATIRLCNLSASPENQPLASALPGLAACLDKWQKGSGAAAQLWSEESLEVDLIANFSPLHKAGLVSTLIVLEDASLTTQRAQQLKLASLGRLTASIAHEVRNPLAAISQAAQLLAESQQRNPEDAHLLEIVLSHCQRMNTIVESVLQLSRQREAQVQEMELIAWLEDTIQQIETHYHLDAGDIMCEHAEERFPVACDPAHLHQVLWNLCENALRYSQRSPKLRFVLGINQESVRPYIDVIDSGTGMQEDIVAQVFEPFFTTEPRGTGLGLYIARELCAINRASLHLMDNSPQGCRLRISFSPIIQEADTDAPTPLNTATPVIDSTHA